MTDKKGKAPEGGGLATPPLQRSGLQGNGRRISVKGTSSRCAVTESPRPQFSLPRSLDYNLELSFDLRQESTRKPHIYQKLIFSNLFIPVSQQNVFGAAFLFL